MSASDRWNFLHDWRQHKIHLFHLHYGSFFWTVLAYHYCNSGILDHNYSPSHVRPIQNLFIQLAFLKKKPFRFPPWAFATVFALINSWHSDRTGEKFWHIALSYGFALLGYIVALSTNTIAGRYISLFGMCMGFSGGIITLGWISSSIPRPPVKRAASIAFINAFANIGQVSASTFLYLAFFLHPCSSYSYMIWIDPNVVSLAIKMG